jgi:type IV secretion system protein TrbL
MEITILIVWWLMHDDTDQLMAHLFVFGVKVGVFAELVGSLFDLSLTFADGCIQVGLLLGNSLSGNQMTLEQFHDPGAIMLTGWNLLIPLFVYIQKLGALGALWEIGNILLYLVTALVGWACVLWIGFNILVGWVELLILSAAAVSYFPFMMFEYTHFLTAGMLSTVAAAGIRMGLLATVLALIFPVLGTLQITDQADPGVGTALALMGVTAFFCYMTLRVQVLAARMSGVSSAFTGGGLMFVGARVRNLVSHMPGGGGRGGSPQPARQPRAA